MLHITVILLALGMLTAIAAIVCALQDRVIWLRWAGAGYLALALLTGAMLWLLI